MSCIPDHLAILLFLQWEIFLLCARHYHHWNPHPQLHCNSRVSEVLLQGAIILISENRNRKKTTQQIAIKSILTSLHENYRDYYCTSITISTRKNISFCHLTPSFNELCQKFYIITLHMQVLIFLHNRIYKHRHFLFRMLLYCFYYLCMLIFFYFF